MTEKPGWVIRSAPVPWWVRVLLSRRTPRVLILVAMVLTAWLFSGLHGVQLGVSIAVVVVLAMAYWITYAQRGSDG